MYRLVSSIHAYELLPYETWSMATVTNELFQITDRLESIYQTLMNDEFAEPLQRLQDVAELAGKSWSGSWLGYHSRIYYHDLVPPPAGAHFSQEWGLKDLFGRAGSVGDWTEYRFDDVVDALERSAGNPDIGIQQEQSNLARNTFDELKHQALSILSSELSSRSDDTFLSKIVREIEQSQIPHKGDFIQAVQPSGQCMTRDMVAIQGGYQTPPHLKLWSEVLAIREPFSACKKLSTLVRRAASHIQNSEKQRVRMDRVGTNVFIGHGASSAWRDLKDFISERIQLPWDEFNRVPIAGVTNIERLSQMLDTAAIAFIVMTAEDEQADGSRRARQNVIHEAGLFQGRLGFGKAIILLEEGCEDFSNVQGLGHIRFPSGNISAAFEEIRRVLEREQLIGES